MSEELGPEAEYPIYYVYFTDDTQEPYFCNAETEETTYDYPEVGTVLNPETGEYWRPKTTKKKKRRATTKNATPDAADLGPVASSESATDIPAVPAEAEKESDPFADVIDLPDEVRGFVPPVAPSAAAREGDSFVPNEDAPYLPSDLQRDIYKFQMTEYARQFFREHRTHTFNRKCISFEALTAFQSEALNEPLLSALDQKSEKQAIQCFKWILNFTGVDTVKNPAAIADKLVAALQTSPVLRDEVMFQLMKQTRQNPNPDWLKKTWELFLIVVTFFPSTKNSEVWIKSHFSQNIRDDNWHIAQLAQFCYIRFSARCAIGKPLESYPPGYIQQIPAQFQSGRKQFGSSLYEQIWNQRRSVQKLPIPYILHHMSEHMLKKGCEETEGLFRLPGNLKKVDEMADETNRGRDAISAAPMNDIASLFKKWFRDLPDPVVNQDSIPLLREAWDTKDYKGFVDKLPRAHKLTLMYLIGFLQRLVKSEPVTKMGPKNMAIVFGPNIVQLNDNADASMIKLFADVAIEFLTTLVNEWDTSEIYPLNPDLLLEGSSK
jgi:hypothetical protein